MSFLKRAEADIEVQDDLLCDAPLDIHLCGKLFFVLHTWPNQLISIDTTLGRFRETKNFWSKLQQEHFHSEALRDFQSAFLFDRGSVMIQEDVHLSRQNFIKEGKGIVQI